VVAPVGERGVAPQRRPGALDRLEHGVEADDPEDRLVLAGEGGGRAVLVERRGADGDGRGRRGVAHELAYASTMARLLRASMPPSRSARR
jgi:hypothetical protein